MKQKRVNVISLGCSKNLVDTERLIKMLEDVGFTTTFESDVVDSDVTVINTCGFISDAKEESINTILECAEAKKSGRIKELIVMGCLSQRYSDELPQEITEVDKWYGKTDWVDMASDLAKKSPASAKYDRVLTTPRHHAYIKISEGCDRFCAYCAIPLITGRHKSRPIEEIVDEIKMLVSRGTKEFNIIAQDLTSYGKDLYGIVRIAELVDAIADVPGVEWIRLHYAYPADFPYDLLEVMSRRDNVCKYLDIALQHISNPVLKNMRRHIDSEATRNLIADIRRLVPGIHIRTTLMVGFPGEGEAEFNELLQFVNDVKFERMGAFAYCEEDDTYAAKNFSDDISNDVKQSRLDKLMAAQELISQTVQDSKIGKTYKVIIDSEQPDYYVGRTEFDSPEVDPEVLVTKNQKLHIGEFYNVTITDALPFELIGEVAD